MASVLDVGQLVTEMIPNVDKMKLYKLCYFAQGWHLAWTGAPLFDEPLCEWRKGPVPTNLRQETEGVAQNWKVPYIPGGCSARLSMGERKVVETVVEFYKETRSLDLSQLSHGKAWNEARGDLDTEQPSSAVMSVSTIREEFVELSKNKATVPAAPDLDFSDERFSYENILRAADDVERDWKATFDILAST